jgi:hypothetical protein
MKNYLFQLGVGLFLAISGCGGGGGGGGPEPSSLSPDAPAPPLEPPPLSPTTVFDCYSTGPSIRPDLEPAPDGVFRGTLVNCAQGDSSEVLAMVSEDGRFRFMSADSQQSDHLLAGILRSDGSAIKGEGLDFAEQGREYFSGASTGLWIDGLIRKNGDFDGRWGTEWGDHGYFTFSPDPGYPAPSSLEKLQGGWSGWNHPDGADVTWTIDGTGRIDGQDTTGCYHARQVALIDTRFSLYDIRLEISGCVLAGDFTGLAFWQEGGMGHVFDVSADDNSQNALRILMVSMEPIN